MAISRDEASAMSKVQVVGMEPAAEAPLGNAKLRSMSVAEVRRLLKKELISDPATQAKWNAWADEWQERERTYSASLFRGFERGEKGGRI